MTKAEKEQHARLRTLTGKLIASAGCSCCRDTDGWDAAQAELAALLNVPAYDDNSGFRWYEVAKGEA